MKTIHFIASTCLGATLLGIAPARATPADPPVDTAGHIAPQALANYTGEVLAEAAHPGGGTVELIETCYTTAATPAAMQKCIALDEVSDFADFQLHVSNGRGHHSEFWTDTALAARVTDERAVFAFGSRNAADAWTQNFLLSAYDTASESSALSGPLSGQIFTFR